MNWQSADLSDGLSGENPPCGMTGGSRRRRSRVLQRAYADHYKLNGLGDRAGSGCDAAAPIGAIQNHKDER
jgi:hypothetical protein